MDRFTPERICIRTDTTQNAIDEAVDIMFMIFSDLSGSINLSRMHMTVLPPASPRTGNRFTSASVMDSAANDMKKSYRISGVMLTAAAETSPNKLPDKFTIHSPTVPSEILE